MLSGASSPRTPIVAIAEEGSNDRAIGFQYQQKQ
jgi:hypothetical protein